MGQAEETVRSQSNEAIILQLEEKVKTLEAELWETRSEKWKLEDEKKGYESAFKILLREIWQK